MRKTVRNSLIEKKRGVCVLFAFSVYFDSVSFCDVFKAVFY